MTADEWERLTEIFHEAVLRSGDDRARFLADRCAGDPTLRAEVARLLSAHERAGRFIETPAIASAGAWSSESIGEPSAAGQQYGPYRIVREIGRGGMGAVYLAERTDGQYEQRVAVKVIKRGMDTDLVIRRFRAERQILASLDHPNIARLLDGGTTTDGRPYFVMEYIAGRPIDEYADTQHLSIPERLELFLKAADAVTHAHRHRVIHRDIKPVNILVTADGVPKLLDFGIAKIFDPDAEGPASSVTGLRMLTPEYASPEQVKGGHATPASDVYSLGVVLYELLTGRSPYPLRSRDPLEVAEAVRTIDPERPSMVVSRGDEGVGAPVHRPGLTRDRAAATGADSTERLRHRLRGDLDTIVLMALRKEAGRRYPAVEGLTEDLRRHLDGRPVLARGDTLRYRTSKFLRRNRTTVVTATLAGAVALGAGAGFVAFRAGRVGTPSLIASGALVPRDRLLVATFTDRAGDPALAAALSEALQVDLTQSPLVQILSARQVRSTLVRMERSPDLALDDSLARDVALREGVKAFVTGSVARVAGRYTISAELVNAQKGDLLAALRETAADSTDLIAAMGRLSRRLRERMGESLRSIRATPPLERVTTPSLAALRAYSAGVRTINAGDRARGLALLDRAVALDTGFASAYRVIGITNGDIGEFGRMVAGLQHAIANQGRLPFYERFHTIASYDYNVLDDTRGAIEAYDRILSRYPDDVRALNNLAYVRGLRREYASEESLLVRAAALDTTIPSIQTLLMTAQMHRGHFDEARRTLNRVEARFPDFFNTRLGEIYLAAAQQDWAAAERQARVRLATRPADTLDALDGFETLAAIVLTQGRIREAEQESRRVLTLSAALGSPGRYLTSALRLADIQLRYRHSPAMAISVLDSVLARFRLDSLKEGDRPYDPLARFFATAGQPVRARALLQEADRIEPSPRGPSLNRRWSLGVIALSEGRASDALAELRRAADSLDCPVCVLPDLARAYDAAGQVDSAIAVYERYLATPWQWRFDTDSRALGWSMRRLGELYENNHEPARAARRYTALLALWSRADRELAPILADVHARIDRLGAGRSPAR